MFLAIFTPLALFILAAGLLADRHGQATGAAGRHRPTPVERPRGRHAARGPQNPT